MVPSPTREIALAMYAGGYSPGIFAYEVIGRLPDSLLTVKVRLKLLNTALCLQAMKSKTLNEGLLFHCSYTIEPNNHCQRN